MSLIKDLLEKSPNDFAELIQLKKHSYNKYDCLSEAAHQADKDGFWMEFGVFSGQTLDILTQIKKGKVYGFDSWEGLPEHWNNANPKGMFNTQGQIPFHVNENMVLVKGWFNDSLPKFKEQTIIDKISLLHLDADLYSSTKCVFDNLKPFFKGDCIIIFDEFFGYEPWEEHEYKAFKEFIFDMKDQILNIDILSYSAPGYHPVSFKLKFK